MAELDHNLYTVAWIAPLYIEAKAALLMLDQKHCGRFAVSRGDDYIFHAGSMFGHNVVIATLPAGQEYGTGSAAALASQLRKSFPNLWFGLLVGVAAGLPNLTCRPPRDIRLGDVLVALPDGDTAGLVAYDLGKDVGDDDFQPLRLGHVLAQTETIVRSAIGKIRLLTPNVSDAFLPFYREIMNEQHENGTFRDPGQRNDILYEVDQHGLEYTVMRGHRSFRRRTKVWYGPIGSGEKLMRNFRQRNQLRDRYNLIGLEMEAAGTMNRIPVGVIRGVCDYADEHKNKEWQPYAAAMAAAYAKAVLREINPDRQEELLYSYVDGRSTVSARAVDPIQEEHFLSRSLSSMPSRSTKRRYMDDELGWGIEDGLDISSDTGRARCFDSAPSGFSSRSRSSGILRRHWPEYQTERPGLSAKYVDRHDTPPQLLSESEVWNTFDRRTPWTFLVSGICGVGKSQMCLKAISEQQHRFQSIFYVDASDRTTADRDYVEISRVCHIQHHWEDITADEQIRITRAWLACQNEPWLLMLDNANEASLPLSRYLPSGGRGTILITSDESQWATDCHTYCQISSMSDDQAFELLLKYKNPEADLDVLETQSAKSIAVNELGGLPLAIAQAGSYIFNNRCTYSEYLEELREFPQELLNKRRQSRLFQQNPHQRTIWSTLSLSIRQIQELPERGSVAAIELLRIMSFLHNDGIDDRIFQEAWKNMQGSPLVSRPLTFLRLSKDRWDKLIIREAIGILCRYSLLNPVSFSKRQYSLHKLVQTVCSSVLSADERRSYSFQAVSLVATALGGIKTSLSWVEDPTGLEMQKLLLPHVITSTKLLLPHASASITQIRHGNMIQPPQSMLDDLGCEDAEMILEIISLFAKAYAATGHYKDAKRLIVDINSRLEDKMDLSIILGIGPKLKEQMASYAAQLGEHTEAYSLRQAILDAFQSQDHCAAMMNLADSTWMVGQREEALSLSQECLGLREKTLPPQDPRLFRTRRKVAEFLHWLNHKRQALDLRESIFHDAKLRDCSTDAELLDFFTTESALADSYQWDGRYLQALQLRRDVYEGRNKILGPDHPETLLAHDRLLITKSSLTNEQGEQQKLCQLLEKSVIIWKRTLGGSHPHTLEAKVNLGLSYSKLEEFPKALNQQKSVLRQRKEEYMNSPPDQKKACCFPYLSSIGKLASLFSKTGQWSKARNMRTKAAHLVEHHCGLHDSITFTVFNKLLNCESAIGHMTSEELIQKRKKLWSDQILHFGPRINPPVEMHPSILETMSFLAVDLEKATHEAKAIDLRRELWAAQKVSLGPENRETLSNMKRLALMLTGKPTSNLAQVQEGIKLLEEVEAVQQKLLGSDSFQARDTRREITRIQSDSHFGESARIQITDIPESSPYLDKITSFPDLGRDDARKEENSEESDSSLDPSDLDFLLPPYFSGLLAKTKSKHGQFYYSDSSSAKFSGESGSEMSDG